MACLETSDLQRKIGQSVRAKSGEAADGHCREDGYDSAEGDACGDFQGLGTGDGTVGNIPRDLGTVW